MYPVIKGLAALTVDFSKAYRLAKKEKGWIDFSDLEHFCLQILLSVQSRPGYPVRSAAAEELRHTFREVLIDEYQDTNGVQELITKLVSCDDNRFMVGDIKQSIYRFRLADPMLFLHKYNTFSREKGAIQRCIDLSKNFRSAPNILAAVNEVFSRAMTEDAAGMGYGEHALTAAEMALAGIVSVIPPDEVVSAMYEIGRAMPVSLKETSEGGLARTPTGKEIAERLEKAMREQ